MACIISNGIARECDFAVGGIDKVYLANKDDVESVAYGSDGSVTGITLTSGATWYEYQPELNSASLTQSLQVGNVSRYVQQTLVFSVASLNQEKVSTLDDLSLTTLVASIRANDGNWYLIGDKGSGLKASAVEVTTGAAESDDAVATVTIQGGNKGYAPIVTDGVIAP